MNGDINMLTKLILLRSGVGHDGGIGAGESCAIVGLG